MTLSADEIRTASARGVLRGFLRSYEGLNTHEIGDRDWAEENRQWPHVLRALDWLAPRLSSDDAAATLFSQALTGVTGIVVTGLAAPATLIAWLSAAVHDGFRRSSTLDLALHYGSLGVALARQGDYIAAVRNHQAALLLGGQDDPNLRLQDFDGLAVAYAALGMTYESERLFQAALITAQDQRSHRSIGAILVHRAQARLQRSQPHAALQDINAAGELFDQHGYRAGLAQLMPLNFEARAQAAPDGTLIDDLDCWLSAALDNSVSRAPAHLTRGSVLLTLGRPADALTDLETARASAERSPETLVEILRPLGLAYRQTGRYTESREALERYRDLVSDYGSHRRWQALFELAETARSAGDAPTAQDLYDRAMKIVQDESFTTQMSDAERVVLAHEDTGGNQRVLIVTNRAAQVATLLGVAALADGETANSFFEQANKAARGDVPLSLLVLERAAQRAFDNGGYRDVIRLQRRCLQVLERTGDTGAAAHALGECADAHRMLGENLPAIRLYQQVADLDEKIGDHRDRVHAIGNIALLLAADGRTADSFRLYLGAAALAAAHDYREGRLVNLTNLSDHAAQDDPDLAAAAAIRAACLVEALLADGIEPETWPDLDDPSDEERAACAAHARAYGDRGRRLIADGELDHGLTELSRAAGFALRAADAEAAADALEELGTSAEQHRKALVAAAAFSDLEAYAAAGQSPTYRDWAMGRLFIVVRALVDDPSAALSIVRRRHRHALQHGLGDGLVRSLLDLIRLRLDTAERDLVPGHLETALGLIRAYNWPGAEAELLYLWGFHHERRRERDAAQECWTRGLSLARHHRPDLAPALETALTP